MLQTCIFSPKVFFRTSFRILKVSCASVAAVGLLLLNVGSEKLRLYGVSSIDIVFIHSFVKIAEMLQNFKHTDTGTP